MIWNWKWKIRFFVFYSHFLPPNEGKVVKLGAHFVVVCKPILDFLILVHWNYFDISSGFLTNRANIVKKRDFRRRGHISALNKWLKVTRHPKTVNLRSWPFKCANKWKLCNLLSGVSIQHVWLICVTHTHAHTHYISALIYQMDERIKFQELR